MKMRIFNRKAVVILCVLAWVPGLSSCDAFQKSDATLSQAQKEELLEKRDDLASVEKSDPAMNAAIAEAKKTLPDFVAKLDANKGDMADVGFKYPLGGWEHIWVGDVKHDGEFLTGVLVNQPAQPEHKMGEAVRVAMKDVSDWAYRDNEGVMQGHYTTKVLLPQLDPEEAASIKQSFGW
jgi:uncharacterized protein YegJ (DUF2314 family)